MNDARGKAEGVEPLLDTDELAALLKITPVYARQMRLTGRGPAYVKVGRAVRYRAADVERWLAARTVTSTSDAQ